MVPLVGVVEYGWMRNLAALRATRATLRNLKLPVWLIVPLCLVKFAPGPVVAAAFKFFVALLRLAGPAARGVATRSHRVCAPLGDLYPLVHPPLELEPPCEVCFPGFSRFTGHDRDNPRLKFRTLCDRR